MKNKFYPDQIVPLGLTFVVFLVMCFLVYLEVRLLNNFVIAREKIQIILRPGDILIGMTIYLKTSIDFAIFIGRLMDRFPGWKNRVMIEIGTALGNTTGTLAILVLWDLFREVRFLMAIMIVIAALVLLRMAQDGLEHVKEDSKKFGKSFGLFVWGFDKFLAQINRAIAPVLNRIVPHLSTNANIKSGYKALFIFSFSVPFILGLDDFAGYIPLFNIVNVLGFSVGVFLGHMILNIFLFLSPERTIKLVKHPVISLVGSLAFVALALWGLWEAAKLVGLGV